MSFFFFPSRRLNTRCSLVIVVPTCALPIFIFDFNAQNFGSRDVDRWGGNARARFAGLTGMGDLTTVSFYATPDFDEQKVVQASHEVRVGGEGLRLRASYTYAWTRPDQIGRAHV